MSLLNLKQFRELRKGCSDKGILVMDGDWLVFKAMAAAEVETDWGDDEWTLICVHKTAREILFADIQAFVERKKAWRNAPIVLAFTDSVNWRKELVDPEYKANRKATRKPVGYRKFLRELWDNPDYMSVLEPRLEGDDVMGIIGSNSKAFGAAKAVLVSCDKDFKTIPDCDFLWCTTGNILQQDLTTADYWHLFQTIKGDLTDGYSGIAGWGDTAAEFINNPYIEEEYEHTFKSGARKGMTEMRFRKRNIAIGENLWDAVVSIGYKAGMTEDDIIAQARMARILRFDEYDIDTQTIKLWEPSMLNI